MPKTKPPVTPEAATDTPVAAAATTTTAAPVTPTKATPAAKAPVKTTAKTTAKTAPKTPKTAKPPKAQPAPKAPKAQPAPKAAKPVKHKLVRDSFTFPEPEYLTLVALKKRLLAAGTEVKKGELVRAGLALLCTLDGAALSAAVGRVEKLKTGRPAK